MKVLFISSSSMGPRFIMGLLKKSGHEALGLYQGIDDYLGDPAAGFELPIPLDALIKESPDIVGFSIDSSSYKKSIAMAEKLRKAMPEVFIIFGGVHPTIFPEKVISHDFVNALCIGEGEYPMLELCNALQNGKTYTNILNLCVRDNKGDIIKNSMRPYVHNLDELDMDRENLYYYGLFSGRGCTGHCTFCNTPAIKRISGKGKFFRKRSVESVLNEISTMVKLNRKYLFNKCLTDKNKLKPIYNLLLSFKKPVIRFKDDTFLANKAWFLEFAQKFSRRFKNISYICNARADEIDEEVGQWLRKSNCKMLGIGFECGNEEFRNNVLKKRVSNEDIFKCANILKQNNIPILGQWIIGLPGESVGNVLESLELSISVGDIAQVHIAQPYPKTEMHNQAVALGLIDEDYIPDNGVYSDFLFHKGETRKIMRLIYNLFSFKDLEAPKDYEIFKHLGRLRVFANQRLGNIIMSKMQDKDIS